MKILQFPSPPGKPESQKTGRRPETGDFEALLKQFNLTRTPAAGAPAAGAPEGPGGLVSLENLRARQLPPAGELKEAGRLLGRLDQAIRTAPAGVLDRVHNLEGLLYIYRTSS